MHISFSENLINHIYTQYVETCSSPIDRFFAITKLTTKLNPNIIYKLQATIKHLDKLHFLSYDTIANWNQSNNHDISKN